MLMKLLLCKTYLITLLSGQLKQFIHLLVLRGQRVQLVLQGLKVSLVPQVQRVQRDLRAFLVHLSVET